MNDTVSWTMREDTIVRKVDREGSQETFGDPALEKVKQGQTMQFNAHVNVEALPQGKHLKKATIFSNVPNGGTWEIISDEGTAVGGRGSAPSPIMYFATGLALCMMSHIEMLANQLGIDLKTRLEQKACFSTTLNLGGIHPKDVFGAADKVDIHLLIETEQSEKDVEDFVRWCRQACMSLQAMTQKTPANISVKLNGAPLSKVA
ncbi:MAG: OsmC family protein [Hyphomicrobiales bacterium]|nr:OsmC family protein [Hyphomicrobiales bacterium]